MIDRKALAEVMRTATLENQSAGIGAATGAALAAGLKFLANAIDALETRIEQEPFRYDGPHETGKAYAKGTFVTHAGSLWHANSYTSSRPGDGPAWTLAAKKGRDAR